MTLTDTYCAATGTPLFRDWNYPRRLIWCTLASHANIRGPMARKPDLSFLAAAAARRAAKAAATRSRANTAKRGATKSEQSAAAGRAAARALGRELGRQQAAGNIAPAQAASIIGRSRLPLRERRAAEESRTPVKTTGLQFDEEGAIEGSRAANLGALRAAPNEGSKVLGGHWEVCQFEQADRWIAYVVDDKGRVKGATPLGLDSDEVQANAEDLASIGKYKSTSGALNVMVVPLRRVQ